MRQKVIFLGVAAVITTCVAWLDDPLNALVSFVLAGTIPQTDITLGMWPTIALSCALAIGLKRFFQHIRFKSLEHTAQQIKAERLKKKFEEESSGFTFNRKNRAVIAAPPAKTLS